MRSSSLGFALVTQVVKNPPANAGDADLIPGSGRSPGDPPRRKWQPILVFLPAKSHEPEESGGLQSMGVAKTGTLLRILIFTLPSKDLHGGRVVSAGDVCTRAAVPMCTLSCYPSLQIRSVTQSCPTLCDPMNRSMPGLPVHQHLPEFTQTHVHRVGDDIQPSHPLSSPCPPVPNPFHHQSLFQ